MASKTSNSPTANNSGKSRLGDTLKELDLAIGEWDKITNNPPLEQDHSQPELQKHTQDLIEKLKEQIDELSAD